MQHEVSLHARTYLAQALQAAAEVAELLPRQRKLHGAIRGPRPLTVAMRSISSQQTQPRQMLSVKIHAS